VVEPAIDDILDQYMFESRLGAVRFFPNFCKFKPPRVHELGKTQPLLGAKYDCHGLTLQRVLNCAWTGGNQADSYIAVRGLIVEMPRIEGRVCRIEVS
jgi:hypothetical protein